MQISGFAQRLITSLRLTLLHNQYCKRLVHLPPSPFPPHDVAPCAVVPVCLAFNWQVTPAIFFAWPTPPPPPPPPPPFPLQWRLPIRRKGMRGGRDEVGNLMEEDGECCFIGRGKVCKCLRRESFSQGDSALLKHRGEDPRVEEEGVESREEPETEEQELRRGESPTRQKPQRVRHNSETTYHNPTAQTTNQRPKKYPTPDPTPEACKPPPPPPPPPPDPPPPPAPP